MMFFSQSVCCLLRICWLYYGKKIIFEMADFGTRCNQLIYVLIAVNLGISLTSG